MDELSILQRTRTDVPERTPEAIRAGRADLFAAINPHSAGSGRANQTHSHSLVRRWASLSAVGAAVIATGLVAGNVLGWPGSPGTDTAAASMLTSAADAVQKFSDPEVQPGQFTRVRTDALYLAQGDVEATAQRTSPEEGGEVIDAEFASVLQSSRVELYVPANRDDDWVWIQCKRSTTRTFGPASEDLAEQISREDEKYGNDALRVFPAGQLPDGSVFSGYQQATQSGRTSDDLDALPREPDRLLDAIYEMNGQSGQSRDGQALVWIADTLRKGVVPADVRAALYRAAAKIPGVTITEEQTTLGGRAGVAVGRVESSDNSRQDIVVDPETGQFIGERRVTLNGFADVPAGTEISSTGVTTTVVDIAPTDTSSCGSKD